MKHPDGARRPSYVAFLGLITIVAAGCGSGSGSGTLPPTPGATGLQRVNHVIVVMQENHSFDNISAPCLMRPVRHTIRGHVRIAITNASTA